MKRLILTTGIMLFGLLVFSQTPGFQKKKSFSNNAKVNPEKIKYIKEVLLRREKMEKTGVFDARAQPYMYINKL